MNSRRIRKWLLILCTMGLLVGIVVAWFVGGLLMAPANHIVGPPPPDFPARLVEFPSQSGTTVAAWHLPVTDSQATVLLLHPIRGDRRSMLSRARLLRDHGYSTLLVDLQAHGESEGESITIGYLEKHDVRAAVRYLRDYDADQKIGIIGWSLGGAAALFAEPDVELLVLESVYPTVSAAVHNRVEMRLGPLHHVVAPLLLAQLKPRLGISVSQLCPIDQLPKFKCPVLIASGDRDGHTPLEETHQIYDAANTPKRLVVFQGAEHVDLLAYDRQKYESEVIGFVNRHLGLRTADAK